MLSFSFRFVLDEPEEEDDKGVGGLAESCFRESEDRKLSSSPFAEVSVPVAGETLDEDDEAVVPEAGEAGNRDEEEEEAEPARTRNEHDLVSCEDSRVTGKPSAGSSSEAATAEAEATGEIEA